MVWAPPFDRTPAPKVSLPVTNAAVSEVIWPAVKAPPLHTRVGVPLMEAVKGSPTSRSLTGRVPVIGARSWAEAFASSATEPGCVIADKVGASLDPVITKFNGWVELVAVPSDTWTE